MKILYAVPWVDIEYGWSRKPEGYKVFDDIDECIKSTKEESESGNYTGGYIGPERPLSYVEAYDEMTGTFPQHVDTIKFRSNIKYIT